MSNATTSSNNVIPLYKTKHEQYAAHYLDLIYSEDPDVQQQIRDLCASGLSLDKAIDKIILDRWGISPT